MDYYEILGVSKDANKEEIKRAFREKSKSLHPDLGGDPHRFSELSVAYKTLIDDEKREYYDKTGRSLTQSLDIYEEARNFLVQLIENHIEDLVCHNTEEAIHCLLVDCNTRQDHSRSSLAFYKRTKSEFESKIGIIESDEGESLFDEVIQKKIDECSEQIALAEVDIQTIDKAKEILEKHHPSKKSEMKNNRYKPTLQGSVYELIEEGDDTNKEDDE